MSQVQLKVEMTCGACENAVRNSIAKNLGDEVKSLHIDLATKLVDIELKSDKYTKEQVVEIVSKCGKKVELVN